MSTNNKNILYCSFCGKSQHEVRKLIKKGVISKGMLPKIESALEAVSSGVEHVQIINGTIDHSVLLELFTDSGVGTMIRRL